MIFTRYVSKWWHRNGWTFIIVLCFLLIIFLWFINTEKNNASSDTSMNNAMNVMFGSNLATNFHNTKQIVNQSVNQTQNEFIYEDGASKGENECRKIMQELTGMKFHKVRLDFMKNPVTGVFLELDCFNEVLQLAIEYNGAQHDKYNKFMHQGSMDKFRNQQYRDYIKKTLCKENGVYLIVVPHTVKLKELRPYLMNKLQPYLQERLESQRVGI